jgi:hypothetical protein
MELYRCIDLYIHDLHAGHESSKVKNTVIHRQFKKINLVFSYFNGLV